MRTEPPVPPASLAAIRAPFLALAAEQLEVPTVLPLALLLDLAGEALRERLFVIQGEGREEACLRPDFTVPAVRAHIASGRASGRYIYEGRAFRVAPAGADRAEEFLQIGLEVFGDGDAAGQDAEIIAIAWRAAAAGRRSDLSLVLGDVALFSAFLQSLGLPAALQLRLSGLLASPRRLRAELAAGPTAAPARAADRLAALLGDVSEDAAAGALEEIWRLSGVEAVGGRSAAEIVHRLGQRAAIAAAPHLTSSQARRIGAYLAIRDAPRAALAAVAELAGPREGPLRAALATWEQRLSALEAAGTPSGAMTFAAGFGRAFGYYDGPLFEVRSAALGADAPLAAGGRYDGLLKRLGGRSAKGAVGCMVRPFRASKDGGA